MKKIFTLFAALAMVMSMSAKPYLRGSFNGWGTGNEFQNGECTINLTANTDYEFKVDNNGDWVTSFGGAAITTTNCTNVNCSGSGNATIKTTFKGSYTFKWDATNKKISVVYPTEEVVKPKKDITVKAKMPATWTNTITAWVWTDEDPNGKAITPEKDGDWYVVTQNTAVSYIIFRNGTDWNGDVNQTADMNFEDNACIQLSQSGNMKATYTNVDCEGSETPDPTPDPNPEPSVISYVLMGVAGDWTTGIALEQNPANEKEYMLLGQEISVGDSIKVVTLTDSVQTAWCNVVDSFSTVTYVLAGEYQNIVLEPGIYDFYFKTEENLIYIAEVEQTPSYETVELTMTNLDVDDDFTTFVGSETMYGVSVSLLPDLTKPIEGMYMTYGLKAGSTLTFSGQNLEIVDGYMTIEMGMTTTVYAVVLAKFGEEQYMFSITMTEPAETQEITETDATVTYEFGALKFLVELEDEDFVSVEVAGFKYPGNVTDQLVEGQQIATFENAAAFAIANKVYVTVTNDTLVEVYGEYTSNFGATYNVTISGVLPVYTVAVTAENGTVTGAGTYIAAQEATLVATAAEGYEFVNWTVNGKEESDEATYTFLAEANIELVANFKEAAKPTISYELNGGAFPTVAVPAAAELLMAFKVDYLAAFNITDATDSDMNVREAGNFIYVMNSKGGDAVKFITENANWKWLHDYILSVAGNIPEGTNVSFYWRANIDGFFHCKNAVAVGGVASADYTEAGKPEVWGAAYQAAKGIVLPTEPVAEAYTLPTPTKEGSVFQGWYDNAEGQGEAMTVIPAGWYGTLYAIWTVEGGAATGLDNAPVVMDVVKVIKNGQLVIIRNGVEYNANGAILK